MGLRESTEINHYLGSQKSRLHYHLAAKIKEELLPETDKHVLLNYEI